MKSVEAPPNGSSRNQRLISRVWIDVVDRDAAIKSILADAPSGRSRAVGFCNAHTVNLAARDERFASVLNCFTVLNDGVGVDLASRLLYNTPFPDNLCGTDFVPAILDAAKSGLRVGLLGSTPEVVERAAATLQKRYPGHSIVYSHHGFFSADEQDQVSEQILAAQPNIILVGMGQPRQEMWAGQEFARFPAVTLCVGAFLEFAAGTASRAPRWLRAVRLEWAYRLAREPRRLGRRYLAGNVEFLVRIFREKLSR